MPRHSIPVRPTLAYVLAAIALLLTLPALAAVQVQEVVSPGGIKAWLVRDKTVPVTAIEFSFKSGGVAHDPHGREGTARLLSATLDEGAGPHGSMAFQELLADKSIGLSFNAGRDSFSGSLYTLNRYRDEALNLLRLALTEPRFDPEPVERTRSQLLVGLHQNETDPGVLAGRVLMRILFDGHAYARPGRGTLESLAAVTVADLRQFLADALTKDRLLIGVVGDITADELGPVLDHVFGGLPEVGASTPVTAFDGRANPGTVVVDLDVPQSTILFALPGIGIDDPRYYAGMVLNQVLGGGSFGDILTEEVRAKRGLAYSVYSFLHPMDHAALWRGGAGTQNARVSETLAVIRDVMTDVRDAGIPADRVADAKTFITGSYPLRFTNSSRIAGQLLSMQYHGFPMDYFETRNALVEAVTANDVNALAAELLDPEALTFVVVGRPQGVEATLPVPDG